MGSQKTPAQTGTGIVSVESMQPASPHFSIKQSRSPEAFLRLTFALFLLELLPFPAGAQSPENTPAEAEPSQLSLQIHTQDPPQDEIKLGVTVPTNQLPPSNDPPPKGEWPIIQEIRIESTGTAPSKEELLAASGLQPKQTCLPSSLRLAVKNIFETKHVQDIQIYQKEDRGSAQLLILVQPASGDAPLRTPGDGEGRHAEGIAATVNKEAILVSELRKALSHKENQLWEQENGGELATKMGESRDQVMQKLIEAKLMLSEYKAKRYLLKPGAGEMLLKRRIDTYYEGNEKALLAELEYEGETVDSLKITLLEHLKIALVQGEMLRPKLANVPTEKREAEAARLRREWLQDLQRKAVVKVYPTGR